jgi:hypothetical protein
MSTDRKNNPIEKANEVAIDALKQIITLSSAILVLTITFTKDLVIDLPQRTSLLWFLPAAWVALIVSIIFAWVAMVEAAYTLEDMGDKLLYIFSARTKIRPGETDEKKISLNERRRKCRKLAYYAQWFLTGGLVLLAFFGLSSVVILYMNS